MGSDTTTAPASVWVPALLMMDFIIAAFSEVFATIIMTSFSLAIETPKNFAASFEPVPLP